MIKQEGNKENKDLEDHDLTIVYSLASTCTCTTIILYSYLNHFIPHYVRQVLTAAHLACLQV